MQETYLKAAHAQRSEAAQNRREEKKRAEKERMMNEDDPDKQRKLEVAYITKLTRVTSYKQVTNRTVLFTCAAQINAYIQYSTVIPLIWICCISGA